MLLDDYHANLEALQGIVKIMTIKGYTITQQSF